MDWSQHLSAFKLQMVKRKARSNKSKRKRAHYVDGVQPKKVLNCPGISYIKSRKSNSSLPNTKISLNCVRWDYLATCKALQGDLHFTERGSAHLGINFIFVSFTSIEFSKMLSNPQRQLSGKSSFYLPLKNKFCFQDTTLLKKKLYGRAVLTSFIQSHNLLFQELRQGDFRQIWRP